MSRCKRLTGTVCCSTFVSVINMLKWNQIVVTTQLFSAEMFDRVQIHALAGPLKDIQRLVLKPLLRCLGCVLRVVEPSPQSGVQSALEQVLIKDLSLLFSVHLSLDPVSQSLLLKNIPTA